MPVVGVTVGKGGVLYGVTTEGGDSNLGTVFEMQPPATAGTAWTESVIHSFTGSDGAFPYGQIAVSPAGTLFGTTEGGPYNFETSGTVFELTPPATAGDAWTVNVLYTFPSSDGVEGYYPAYGVVLGKHGVLYGTTMYGGPNGNGTGGVVFALLPPGGAWKEAILHAFSGSDGQNPESLVSGGGVLYCSTPTGGASGGGTVFSLQP